MKKVLMSLATIGILSALVTGASFALFTANAQTEGHTFSAGTVTLGQPTSFTCLVSTENLAPGDGGYCDVSVTYTGSLEAWIGVDAVASGSLFKGTHRLRAELGRVPAGAAATSDERQEIAVAGDVSASAKKTFLLGRYQGGQTASVRVWYQFPAKAGNEFQGASGQIHLTFKAVQTRNNDNGSEPVSWQ